MTDEDMTAGFRLIETGTLVPFRVLKIHTELSPDGKSLYLRAELTLGNGRKEDEEYDDPMDIAEWGSFGFIFVFAVLSFVDARPRGLSEADYNPDDEFKVADFLECLSFRRGELYFSADYIRGRSVKTTVTIKPDGKVTLTTWGRGQAALRWLDRLKGKKLMRLV